MDNFLVNTKEMGPRDWVFDAAVALAVFAFGCIQLALTSSPVFVTDDSFRQLIGVINTTPPAASYVALGLTTLPLVLRRQFSWPVFIFVLITFLGTQSVFHGYSLSVIGPAVAVFTIAFERGRTEAVIASAIAAVSLFVVASPAQSIELAWIMRLQNVSFIIVGALAGYALRTRREYLDETEQRAIAAEKSREDETARHIEEERVRIAREIHDITAHSLSALSVQAAAAQRLIDTDPAAAKEAIATVRKTSKDALEEIRCMIGVLRSGDTQAETTPTAGTDRMGDLVAYLEEAGLEVDYDHKAFEGERVPAYIDVALFGIAREAATNVVRHAQATKVSIRLATTDDSATLEIRDDGQGMGEHGPGHGMQGMRERVNLLDGTFSAEDRRPKGFAVRVKIPLGTGR